jgi:cystathionine beta-lyase
MMLAAPDHADRIITINAASKTFGIPGLRTGYAIIPDPDLRAAYQRRMRMTEYSPGTPGIAATKAAYSPEGAAWVHDLVTYLDGNRKVFDEGINAIPGLWSMPLQSTFLGWVDFSGTGMTQEEIMHRVRDVAKIGVNPGPAFGPGGEMFNRFNFAMRRAWWKRPWRGCNAFSDLQ